MIGHLGGRMDPATLAATVTSQVLLPYIKEGATKLASTVGATFGNAVGQHAVETAAKVWERVKSAFTSERDAATLEDFKEHPEDSKNLLQTKLELKLRQDSDLAAELTRFVTSTSPDGKSSGAQVIGATYAALVDARGATISGGAITGIAITSHQNANWPIPRQKSTT